MQVNIYYGSGLILRKTLDCTGGDIYGERGARAYNGGLGAEPPAGVQGAEPPVGGQGGEAPLKLTAFWILDAQRKQQVCLILRILRTP